MPLFRTSPSLWLHGEPGAVVFVPCLFISAVCIVEFILLSVSPLSDGRYRQADFLFHSEHHVRPTESMGASNY